MPAVGLRCRVATSALRIPLPLPVLLPPLLLAFLPHHLHVRPCLSIFSPQPPTPAPNPTHSPRAARRPSRRFRPGVCPVLPPPPPPPLCVTDCCSCSLLVGARKRRVGMTRACRCAAEPSFPAWTGGASARPPPPSGTPPTCAAAVPPQPFCLLQPAAQTSSAPLPTATPPQPTPQAAPATQVGVAATRVPGPWHRQR